MWFYYDGKQARLLSKKPPTFGWGTVINSKSHGSVRLQADYVGMGPSLVPITIRGSALSVCKSNLQKCVRARDRLKAQRTAMAICSIDPIEMLRRLTAIIHEDAVPYVQDVQLLVWLLLACSRGYFLGQREHDHIAHIIQRMCESSHYDQFYPGLKCDESVSSAGLTPDQHEWIRVIQLRREAGGMWWDRSMLDYAQAIWCRRFRSKSGSEWWQKLQQPLGCASDTSWTFGTSDILPSGVDYHPFPFILRTLGQRFPDRSEKELKLAIWMCRSRINERQPFDPSADQNAPTESTVETYKLICPVMDKLCGKILDKLKIHPNTQNKKSKRTSQPDPKQ